MFSFGNPLAWMCRCTQLGSWAHLSSTSQLARCPGWCSESQGCIRFLLIMRYHNSCYHGESINRHQRLSLIPPVYSPEPPLPYCPPGIIAGGSTSSQAALVKHTSNWGDGWHQISYTTACPCTVRLLPASRLVKRPHPCSPVRLRILFGPTPFMVLSRTSFDKT